jgi:hypothetical protein
VPKFPEEQKLNRHDAKTPRWKLCIGMILPWRLGVMAVQSSLLPGSSGRPGKSRVDLAFADSRRTD